MFGSCVHNMDGYQILQWKEGVMMHQSTRSESLNSSPVRYGDVDDDSSLFNSSASTMSSVKSKTLSTTDTGFKARAYLNGILFHTRSDEPSNIAEIRAQLDAEIPENDLPPKRRFVRYQKSRRLWNINETTVAHLVSIYLLKVFEDDDYESVWDRVMGGTSDSSAYNRGLSPPKPDILQGFTANAFTEKGLDLTRMSNLLSFKDDPDGLVLPHLAGECKSPNADQALAIVQSGYDGAVLVESRLEALRRMDTTDVDKHAHVLTFTFNGTNLCIFAHFAVSSKTASPLRHHHQFPVAELSLVSTGTRDEDYHTFLRLHQLVHNVQKFAKQQAEMLMQALVDAASGGTLLLDPLPATFTPEPRSSNNKRKKAGLGIPQVDPPPTFPEL
jgi:hypothetical protein